MDISTYFHNQLSKIHQEEVKESVKSLTFTLTSDFKSKIISSSIKISEKRKRFIPKQAKPIPEEDPPLEKPKHNKQEREEHLKEHQKKVEETKEFTKKLITERLLREKRIQEKDENLKSKAEKDLEEQRKRQEEIQRRLEEDKQKRLQEMIQKSEIRKKQIEELKDQINSRKPSQKPLYKQMEDNFKQQFELPLLEQQKAELAKKRIKYQPINPEEIKEHSKKHEEIRREQEYKRKKELEQRNLEAQVNLVSNNLQSKFTAAVLEEERLKREEKARQEQEKKSMMQKKNQYAKLVKEMFPPIINETKRLDIDDKKRSLKVLRSAKSGDHAREGSIVGGKYRPGDYKSEAGEPKIQKRVWKENKMIKKPEPKREGKIIDYLLEKRNENKDKPRSIDPIQVNIQDELLDDDFDEIKAKRIKAKAEKLEKIAHKQERLMAIGKVDSVTNLKVGDQVNDLILNSIKTKLALLDKFTLKN